MSNYNNYQGQGEAANYLGYSGNNQGYHQQSQCNYGPEEHSHEFGSMVSSIMNNTSSHQPAQDHEIRSAHQSYEQVMNNPGQHNSSEAVGNAAAVHALQRSQETGGGMGDMIKMAMSMASKMSGGGNQTSGHASNDGNKNQAIQQAAMMAVKLYMSKQSAGNGAQSGGSSMGNMLSMLMGSAGGQQQQQQHSSSGGGLGAALGSMLGGGNHSSQGQQQQHSSSGGGLGAALGSMLGGGNHSQGQQQQHSSGGGGLGAAVGSMLGGGNHSQGQQSTNHGYGQPADAYHGYGAPSNNNNHGYAQQGGNTGYGNSQNYGNQQSGYPQGQQQQQGGNADYAKLASGLMNKLFK